MNRSEQNSEELLDRIIGGIRDEPVDDQQVEQSSRRVWEQIAKQRAASNRLATCSDFQALIPAYNDGTLAPGRKMLLEDHTQECVACRKLLFRELAPVSNFVEMPRRKMTTSKWMAIAASATVALIAGRWGYEQFAPAPAGSRATVQMADGNVYRLHNGMLQPVSVGTELAAREDLRTAAGSHAVVKLLDGSIVEMGERAELAVTAARRDTTVHLNRGQIIVQAAKRRSGHLYIASGDSRVAVTGTVFSVNRGAKGTRVSVMEGEVVVEQGHNDKVLHAGDQLATHRSMEAIAIRDEIAWSRNASEHLKTLADMVAIKDSLERVRLPGIRYQSRLLDAVPANAVFFLSVPNMRDAIADAQQLFASEMKRNGAQLSNEKMNEFIDRIGRFSEFLGEELVVAGVRSGQEVAGIAIADVHRPGLREFLEAEKVKAGESKVQIVEGTQAIRSTQKEELLVAIRDNRVVFGVDEALVNNAFRSGSGFAATPFGQRIQQAFREGTGIVFGADLHSIVQANATQADERAMVNRLGADSLRYVIAEQKTFNGKTQHSAILNFDGPRQGLASWLGAPGTMGGLGFVSSDAQFAASVITKNPQEMIEDLLALVASKGPKGLAELEEMQRITGVDIKRDIAPALGSEVTIALDGPMLPIPSWKAILEVNKPELLQQSIEKIVTGVNLELRKSANGGVGIQAETDPQGKKVYVIRFTGETTLPAIYYTYSGGYLVAGASKELLASAIQKRSDGSGLDRSDRFRRLLPTDQHANFSALVYQNAQEALKLLANVAPGDQEKVRELVDKVGPTLIGAYATADRIQVSTFGSSMDLLMQTALAPMFHGGHTTKAQTKAQMRAHKYGTPKQAAAYR